MDDSQVEQLRDPDDLCSEGAVFDGCQYIDLTELEVYGSATGLQDVQLLSFNDFHGHLLANDEPQAPLPAGAECRHPPAGATGPTCVGGAPSTSPVVRLTSTGATSPTPPSRRRRAT